MRIAPKVIEQGDGYKLVEFPFWASERLIAQVMDNIRRDASVEGRDVRITVGHRRVRIEEVKR